MVKWFRGVAQSGRAPRTVGERMEVTLRGGRGFESPRRDHYFNIQA